MDGRRRGRKLNAVPPALLDNFGFVKRQLVNGRHYNAVACGFDFIKGAFQLFIFFLHGGKGAHLRHKTLLTVNFQACFFRKNLIEQIAVHRDGNPRRALPQLHGADFGVCNVFTAFQFFGQNCHIADEIHFLRSGADCRIGGGTQFVFGGQRHKPRGEVYRNFPNREFKQHLCENLFNVTFRKLQAVHRQYGDFVLRTQLFREPPGTVRLRIGAVEQYHKRFVKCL